MNEYINSSEVHFVPLLNHKVQSLADSESALALHSFLHTVAIKSNTIMIN